MPHAASRIPEHRYWAVSLVVLGTIGLSTGLVSARGFWSSYVLDIVGPAWNYMLLRGLFSKAQPAMLSRFLTPEGTLFLIIAVCGLTEAAQYFQLYEAHYDPYDFLAYVSLFLPCYAIDRWLRNCQSGQASLETGGPAESIRNSTAQHTAVGQDHEPGSPC